MNLRLWSLAVLFLPMAAHAGDCLPGVTATLGRPTYPILIGNKFTPVVRVTLTVGKVPGERWDRNDVRLASLSFSLQGTDDLRDIESVSLVATGDDERFKQVRWANNPPNSRPEGVPTELEPIGPAVPADREATFRTDRLLIGGKNVFWLSCRLRASADLAHHIAATCTEIGTSAGALQPADPAPGRRQRIGLALRKQGDDGVDTYGIPSIATTPRGTLLCVYDMRWNYPGHDLQDRITTGLSRSTDGGRSWDPMRTILDMGEWGGLPPEQNGCSDPGIIVDRTTGEIFTFAVWMHGNPNHHQWLIHGSAPGYEIGRSAQILMVQSKDDGRTWSQPENLTRELKRASWWLIAPAPTQGIQLHDGTLVMPMEGRDETGDAFSTIMSSPDHGAHWTVGSPVPGGSECAAAELGDGSVMLNMRNRNDDLVTQYRRIAVTNDLGRTWHPHATSLNTLIEPTCNASLLRVDDDADGAQKHVLLFENPHRHANRDRSHHTLQVSFDDGRSWPLEYHLPLDDGFGWGYPCLTQLDSQRIAILYSGSQADLQFQVLPLAEILHRPPTPLTRPEGQN